MQVCKKRWIVAPAVLGWTWDDLTRLVAISPIKTIHTRAPRLEDSAARQHSENEASPSSFSIYPRFQDRKAHCSGQE